MAVDPSAGGPENRAKPIRKTSMGSRRTHYDALGIGRDASSVDIASAFREKLAELKAQPETSAEALAAVRDAYQTLANPDARASYDDTLTPLPTARSVRAARAAPVAAADEGEEPGFFQSRKAVIGIAILVVMVAVWGWKASRKPAPQARIVSVTQLDAAPQPDREPAGESSPAAVVPVTATAAAVVLSAEELFAAAAPGVVRVLVADGAGLTVSQGSGVVIGAFKVITNCHVTRDGAAITVMTAAANLPATISVADEEFDLCSLDVPRLDAPPLAVGSIGALRTGQRVYAIGAPMGLELTISEGIVSSLRDVGAGQVIQTTAPVSPGSSGGGLFTTDGTLVGVVTFQHRYGQNLNFAVPADWIGQMRTRSAAASPARATSVASAEPTTAQLMLGKWHCFGSLSGRNGEYTYRSDGMLRVVSNDGRNFAVPYRLAGRSLQYAIQGEAFTFEIESISRTSMVQVVGDGQRLACDRTS